REPIEPRSPAARLAGVAQLRRSASWELRSNRGFWHLLVSSGNQGFGHQREHRQDQAVNNSDGNYAGGETAIVLIKACPENVAKSRCDPIEPARHHQCGPL